MISYRFKRRAFLTAMSGGVGLKILLRNMEAVAQGTTKSPGRLLVSHWPVGIVAGSNPDTMFAASSGSVGGSMGLQPFADAGLGADMTVIKGISSPVGAGGSHEGGTPALVTGVACPGTRSGETEGDDGYAGGPSFEQVMLAAAGTPLKSPGSSFSYINLGCDTRTDYGETSTKCLSYGTGKQSVGALSGPGQENIPLMPNLAPLTVYNTLFMNFVPPANYIDPGNAAAPPAADTLLTNLASRRSVLDFAATEIDTLRQMAPGEARTKLDNHFDAIKQMEDGITTSINNGYPNPTGMGGMGGNTMGMGGSMGGSAGGTTGQGGRGGTTGTGGRGGTTGQGGRGGTTGTAGTTGGTAGTTGSGGMGGAACRNSLVPPANVMGIPEPRAGGYGNTYGDPTKAPGGAVAPEDATNLGVVGKAHMGVLKAAFICDLLRCGTLLWAPGTNHVGFKGLYPGQTGTVYQHHPASHKIVTSDTTAASSVSGLGNYAQFLFQVQLWFFKQMADSLKDWKTSYDGFGNSLLDYTVVPYVTEVLATGHERSRMPAMIIGGKLLGFGHNKYVSGSYTVNQFWGTIGPSLGYTSTAAPFAGPISGIWTKPA
jgi:Protein of unknown function (DUF1552)